MQRQVHAKPRHLIFSHNDSAGFCIKYINRLNRYVSPYFSPYRGESQSFASPNQLQATFLIRKHPVQPHQFRCQTEGRFHKLRNLAIAERALVDAILTRFIHSPPHIPHHTGHSDRHPPYMSDLSHFPPLNLPNPSNHPLKLPLCPLYRTHILQY